MNPRTPSRLAAPFLLLLLCLTPRRAGGDGEWPYYSPAAGRHQLQLTPQCEMDHQVPWAAFAVDDGLGPRDATHAGHVVALAAGAAQADERPGPGEASGCISGPAVCVQRPIAWSDDVGPELAVALQAGSGFAGSMPNWLLLERAGGGGADLYADGPVEAWAALPKWRYASVGHLPAPRGLDPGGPGGLCRVFEGGLSEKLQPFEASVPGDGCRASNMTRCHGRRSQLKMLITGDTIAVADRDAWCLDYANPSGACSCETGPAADCRYPNPTSVEIDPRNGWAYLSTDVGLLSSPSGGRRWIRQGGGPSSNPADIFRKMVALDTFVADPAVHGAELNTREPSGQIVDLNAEPARIQAMGKLTLAFSPCPAEVFYAGTQRRRGHLVATLPVTWLQGKGSQVQQVEGEFTATQTANCDAGVAEPPPGALRFWLVGADR